ncbi:hypothetical protein CFBP7900_22340 [Xanthomonas hortorum pv. carotae]|uniref:Uncharacterized protein n=1 Tax=Xanthomonas hortorum pv. carotae TaxID=487904 RepID=A0A6V7DJU1_9XANT|nr:hypothetical protein CFBP7900_22120 [Xanthomonas hortorum pv. carotae]CAD0335747.1 hypothetical protein CFBP7900_22120 [Xanthomonas hortorum pv. carotae]CAD0336122.1 hypothetical protein CFBP7900_22340 [Xanthomonas hortorum pv. carotae]CAD0336129.1 hypothetical protein CFBP7900_22340 [Xanthomonas hortorum pv. carotae]
MPATMTQAKTMNSMFMATRRKETNDPNSGGDEEDERDPRPRLSEKIEREDQQGNEECQTPNNRKHFQK